MRRGNAITIPVIAAKMASKRVRTTLKNDMVLYTAKKYYASFMLPLFMTKGKLWRDRLNLLTLRWVINFAQVTRKGSGGESYQYFAFFVEFSFKNSGGNLGPSREEIDQIIPPLEELHSFLCSRENFCRPLSWYLKLYYICSFLRAGS